MSSPDLLARVERMVGVNQGERVRLVISRDREDTGLTIADIGKYFCTSQYSVLNVLI